MSVSGYREINWWGMENGAANYEKQYGAFSRK